MKTSQNNADYCRALVRNDDRERYLVSLFAPSQSQRALWALYAFNQEIAKIRENVSDPMLGTIRLQWWQEVLLEIKQGSVREQPVIGELAPLLNADTPAAERIFTLLNTMIEARQTDMFGEGTANFEALTTYADGAGGAVQEAAFWLIAQHQNSHSKGSVSLPTEEETAAARTVGAAWAMLGLIRALPYHWQTNRSYMPEDLHSAMQAQNPLETYAALKPTIMLMREWIEEKLVSCIPFAQSKNRALKASLLYIPLIQQHLKILEKAANNPFETAPYEKGDFRKLLLLFWSSLTGRL